MEKKQKLFLIYNPNSGKGRFSGTLSKIAHCLSDKFDLVIRVSISREQARDIAREITAAEKKPLIAAAGGDGTVNDIINGADIGNLILGIIPVGSVNIIAKELGIPENIRKSCIILKKQTIDHIDVSTANETRFIFSAGLGFDADIIRQVDINSKLLIGKAVYGLGFIKVLKEFRPFYARVCVDGNIVYEGDIFECIAGKSRYYAGKFILFPGASLKNGKIDFAVFTHKSKNGFISGCLKFFAGKKDPDLKYWRGYKIEVSTKEKIFFHVDGDNGYTSPVVFSVEEQKLNIIVT